MIRHIFKKVVLVLLMPFALQAQQFTCLHTAQETLDPIEDPGLPGSINTKYYPNGEAFTPKGDFRALLVFVGFEDEYKADPNQNETYNSQGFGGWNILSGQNLPIYVNSDGSTGLFYQDISEFPAMGSPELYDPTDQSLSNYYYQMSGGDFRFMADVFSDINGNPVRVDINPDDALGGISFSTLNALTIAKMKEINPDFDWSPYDNRTNYPNYEFDNSVTAPDSKADFVVFIYRYGSGFNPPIPGFGVGGIATTHLIDGVDYNDHIITGEGFTSTEGTIGSISGFQHMFLHEVGHVMYGARHYNGANNTIGTYFFQPSTAYGMMGSGATYNNTTANAWERYACGWLDLTTGEIQENTDIKESADLNSDGIYTLRDFSTTSDAIRIKIPHTEHQYLWVENHQKISQFDENTLHEEGISADGEVVPYNDAGVYMYVEHMEDDRYKTPSDNNIYGLNGLRQLNAQGNYDYSHSETGTVNSADFYGNIIYTYQRENENPFSGTNPYYLYIDDYPEDYSDATTTDNSIYRGLFSNTEAHPILRETNGTNTNMLFGNQGGLSSEAVSNFNRHSSSFLIGDKVGLSGIVPISNTQVYDSDTQELSPIYLNGLSVEILESISYDGYDAIKVKISFDDIEVKENKRWCGNIELLEHPTGFHDLIIDESKTLTIDKSGTANRTSLSAENDFITPTTFTVNENTSMLLRDGATMKIRNGSTVRLKSSSLTTLNQGSCILVEAGSKLIVEDNAELRVFDGATVHVEPGGTFAYSGGDIKLIGNDAQLKVSGKLAIADNTEFTFTGTGYIKFEIPFDPDYNNSITYGTNASFVLEGADQNDKVMEVDGSFNIDESLTLFKVTNAKVVLHENKNLNISSPVHFRYTTFTRPEGTSVKHKGLVVWGQDEAYIRDCIFEYGVTGMQANLAVGGSSLTMMRNDYRHCDTGFQSKGKNVKLHACNFYNNDIAWKAQQMEGHSNISLADIYDNNIGIDFSGQSGSKLNVSSGDVYNNATGIGINRSTFRMTTTDVYDNDYGINAIKSTVYLGENASNTFTNNGNFGILLTDVPYIILADGCNEFVNNGYNYGTDGYALAGNVSSDMGLTVDTNGDYQLDISNNIWPTSPSLNQYIYLYYLNDTADETVLFTGNNLTQGTLSCSSGGIGTYDGYYSEQISEPIISSSFGGIIDTGSFPDTPLADAVVEAVDYMSTGSTLRDDLTAITLLHEILGYQITTPTSASRYLQDFAYTALLEAHSNAYTFKELIPNKAVDGVEPNAYLSLVTKVIDDKIEALIMSENGSMQRKSKLLLDKSHMYRVSGHYDYALALLNQSEDWATDKDYLNTKYWECVCDTENKMLKGLIKKEELTTLVAQCKTLLPPQRKAAFKAALNPNYNPETIAQTVYEAFSIQPNVTDKEFALQIPAYNEKDNYQLEVVSVTGQILKQVAITSNNQLVSVDLPAGYYRAVISINEENVSSLPLIITRK